MKRIGNLYERVCEPDNIYLAYTKARKGKTKSYGVVQFEKELERNLEEIHEKLKDESYRTSEYQTFFIHDPKEREIYRLPFKDRVVQHAIMSLIRYSNFYYCRCIRTIYEGHRSN